MIDYIGQTSMPITSIYLIVLFLNGFIIYVSLKAIIVCLAAQKVDFLYSLKNAFIL